MADGTVKAKKDSVSINTCIGDDLFYTLEMFCAITGQSKTIAVERAIESYCKDSGVMSNDAMDQTEE